MKSGYAFILGLIVGLTPAVCQKVVTPTVARQAVVRTYTVPNSQGWKVP